MSARPIPAAVPGQGLPARLRSRWHALRLMRRLAAQTARGDGLAGLLLGLVIGIVGAMLLVHWSIGCQERAAMCGSGASALAMLRLPDALAERLGSWWHRLADAAHRLDREWRFLCLRARYLRALEDAEHAAGWIAEDQMLLADARARLEEVRPLLSAAHGNRRLPRHGRAAR